MEINDKNVKGIFIYQKQIKFNKGDLIVFKDVLYKVIEDVINIEPGSKEGNNYYELYLNEPTGTTEDYFNYVNSSDNSGDLYNKPISIQTLNVVLNTFMSGFNEKGIISNYIDFDGNIYVRDYCTNYNFKYKYLNALDTILVEPSLNNTIFIVSMNVVKDIIGELPGDENSKVLLRQYTYRNKDIRRYVRIQELIDYKHCIVRFRYIESNEDSLNFNIESAKRWNTQSLNDDFMRMVNSLINKATDIINKANNSTIVLSNPIKGSLNFSAGSTRGEYITDLGTRFLTISYHRLVNNLIETKNIIVDTRSFTNSISYVAFNDDSTSKITVTKTSNNIQININNGALIDNIYGRN